MSIYAIFLSAVYIIMTYFCVLCIYLCHISVCFVYNSDIFLCAVYIIMTYFHNRQCDNIEKLQRNEDPYAVLLHIYTKDITIIVCYHLLYDSLKL